jgi:predicted ribonuclease YlaK
MEIEERKRVIEDTVTEIREQVQHWSHTGQFVVPDTSMFIKHPQKFRDWNLSAELGTAELDIHVLMPIIVVDELDRLKDSKDRHVRWRAAHTLGVLDVTLGTTGKSGQLVAGDPFARRGSVTVEVVLDPPRHVRLPIDDDEIIDRALAIQAISGHSVTLLTYDTSQSTRARQTGLPVRKLNSPDEPEPPAKC